MKEKVAKYEKLYKGKVSLARYATSHCLQWWQAKETVRLLTEVRRCPDLESDLARKLRHTANALEIIVEGARHELGVARLFYKDGEDMVELIEEHDDDDDVFKERRKTMKKTLKQDRIDNAIINGKSIVNSSAPATTAVSKSFNRLKRDIGKKRGGRRGQGGKVAKDKSEKPPPTCYNCGGKGHLSLDCRKKPST